MFLNNFNTPRLNKRSIAIVKDLYDQLTAGNAYPNFKLSFNDLDDGGSSSISLLNPTTRRCVVKYMFFSLHQEGNIENIAIYGANLHEFHQTINRSKNIFGFKVLDISIETQNTNEPFVDIYIEPYGVSDDVEIWDFETQVSMANLERVRKVLEKNKYGRKYRVIDFKMEFQGEQTYAAIIPESGAVVTPVVVGNETSFVATGDIPDEEFRLYYDSFGG
ncbi:hypothetical protein C8N47_105141 [Mangrovibacterium marinum]|uniref:Uncharacterized protein n=1 Tax=Mangrovibacterium marinum TaxID=1639118 RepID=A0A2T5C3E2_9BACT|nr:hypothetical protein [Mangrovibacterium marinum]PTN09300.1 hypothetical protein C8N47_105141 [Mangrovibacterium marinum]